MPGGHTKFDFRDRRPPSRREPKRAADTATASLAGLTLRPIGTRATIRHCFQLRWGTVGILLVRITGCVPS